MFRFAVQIQVVFGIASCAMAPPQSEPHALLGLDPVSRFGQTLTGVVVTVPVKGRVTVLDFWGSYCKPCLEIMPRMEALHRKYRSRGVRLIGIADDDNAASVQRALAQTGVTYDTILDGQAGVFREVYGVAALPRCFVLDQKGRLRYAFGTETADLPGAVLAAVEHLLSE